VTLPTFYRHTSKRIFDLLIALPALILLSPLLAVLALLVRVKLGAPVFFRQQRPGLHGKPFRMVKFRSMTDVIRLFDFCPILFASQLIRLSKIAIIASKSLTVCILT
jgi:hypothetical protein